MKPERNPSWRVPTVMLSSLTVALCIAVGHDLFYRTLNGRLVPYKSFKIAAWTTTVQQVNIAAGTAFVFLFSAALTVTTSLAYMQLFFQAVRTPSRLSRLDHLYSGLGDLTSLIRAALHRRHWLLTSTALISWLLPLAAVFPTAALTVEFAQSPTIKVQKEFVPQVAFESLSLTHFDCFLDTFQTLCGSFGAAMDVTRTAVASAAAGSILPITPPGVNATWQLNTELPRTTCDVVDSGDPAFKATEKNIRMIIGNMSLVPDQTPPLATRMFQYVSWSEMSAEGPFNSSGPQGGFILKTPDNYPGHIPDLYVGVFGRVREDIISGDRLNASIINWYFAGLNLLRCTLGASQYTLRFTYNGTTQSQYVEIENVEAAMPYTQGFEMLRLFVPSNDGSGPFSIGADNNVTGANGTKILRTFSYSSVWRAFGNLVVGANNAAGDATGKANILIPTTVCTSNQSGIHLSHPPMFQAFETQVFSTSLWGTTELAPLLPRYYINPLSDQPDPSNKSWSSMKKQFDGLIGGFNDIPRVQRSLQYALEELFFNITISLASLPSLRYNESSTFAPPLVPVTYNDYGNRYIYLPMRLWLPYGLALAGALLNVSIGLWVIYVTGAAFTPDFSTIFRIAKNSFVEVETNEVQLPGKSPLPKKLGRATLYRNGSDAGVNSREEQAYVQVDQSEQREEDRGLPTVDETSTHEDEDEDAKYGIPLNDISILGRAHTR